MRLTKRVWLIAAFAVCITVFTFASDAQVTKAEATVEVDNAKEAASKAVKASKEIFDRLAQDKQKFFEDLNANSLRVDHALSEAEQIGKSFASAAKYINDTKAEYEMAATEFRNATKEFLKAEATANATIKKAKDAENEATLAEAEKNALGDNEDFTQIKKEASKAKVKAEEATASADEAVKAFEIAASASFRIVGGAARAELIRQKVEIAAAFDRMTSVDTAVKAFVQTAKTSKENVLKEKEVIEQLAAKFPRVEEKEVQTQLANAERTFRNAEVSAANVATFADEVAVLLNQVHAVFQDIESLTTLNDTLIKATEATNAVKDAEKKKFDADTNLYATNLAMQGVLNAKTAVENAIQKATGTNPYTGERIGSSDKSSNMRSAYVYTIPALLMIIVIQIHA